MSVHFFIVRLGLSRFETPSLAISLVQIKIYYMHDAVRPQAVYSVCIVHTACPCIVAIEEARNVVRTGSVDVAVWFAPVSVALRRTACVEA